MLNFFRNTMTYLSDHHAIKHVFQLSWHQNQTLDSFPYILETSSHHLNQSVESNKLLQKHSVHRFLITHWILHLKLQRRIRNSTPKIKWKESVGKWDPDLEPWHLKSKHDLPNIWNVLFQHHFMYSKAKYHTYATVILAVSRTLG